MPGAMPLMRASWPAPFRRLRFPRAARALLAADYLRRSPARVGGEAHHKEWHHFIVHAAGLRLLVNLSLLDDPWQPDARRAETASPSQPIAGGSGPV